MVKTSLITKEMEQMDRISDSKINNQIKRITDDSNLYVLERIDVTARISVLVIDYPNSDPASWAFYPKSGCLDYITGQSKMESYDEFVDRSVNTVLKNHDWFDRDVMIAMENRNMKSVQRERRCFA